jgi:hypothetical protein
MLKGIENDKKGMANGMERYQGDKSLEGEHSVSEQVFRGVQKMAGVALEKIGEETRRARREGKLGKSQESPPKKVETRQVKKKKVALGDDSDGYDDEMEDENGWDSDGSGNDNEDDGDNKN